MDAVSARHAAVFVQKKGIRNGMFDEKLLRPEEAAAFLGGDVEEGSAG
jgi:hypothetical protein